MAKTPYIVWKDEYRVSHNTLDRHHQHMFTLINSLYDAMGTPSLKTEVPRLLKNVLDYARVHFEAEEKVMESVQYSGLADQEQAHRTYTRRLEELIRQNRANPDTLSQDLLLLLKEWWLNHILRMDKAYAPFLNKK